MHCKHRVMDICKKNGMPCTFEKHCFEPEEVPVKTNADRIRDMTDEQLLDFMVKTIGNAVMCQALGTEPKFCTLEWLKSPVEDQED